jgi:hypothetical protein
MEVGSDPTSMPERHLAEWKNFYVIVGASAAALTGLLLFIGIHKAWDSAVDVTQRGRQGGAGNEPPAFEDSGD